jgi:multidrug efflux pump subunit AcrA (membrane-fusion protein)
MKLRQIIISASAIAVLGGSIGIQSFLAGQKEPPKKVTPPQVKKYVKTAEVVYDEVQTSIEVYGRVEAAQSIDLMSEVSGRLLIGDVSLKPGSNFRKDQLLYQIDDVEARLDLKAQKSNFLKDLAAILPDMKLDFSDRYAVWSQYFASISVEDPLPALPVVLTDKEKTFLATKGIFSSFYAIQKSEVRLNKHKFFAPFQGSVVNVALETGSYVNPGTMIGRIIRSDALELHVDLKINDLPFVKEGTEAKVYTEETGQQWAARIIRLGDFVNQNTQSIDAYIAIEANANHLYDGQFLKAMIPTQTIKDGMIIPRNALYEGNKVFVLEDSVLKTKSINIVKRTETEVVFNGLDTHSDVVIEPLVNAHNNMKAFKAGSEEFNSSNGVVATAASN